MRSLDSHANGLQEIQILALLQPRDCLVAVPPSIQLLIIGLSLRRLR
jgi:hypothetical protein